MQNDSSVVLSGNEIILAANQTLNLASGSDIEQTGGATTGLENLTVGNASVAGSGDGVLLRVSGDPNAQFTRLGVNTSDTVPQLTMEAGASVSGVAVTLDSTSGATLVDGAELDQNGQGQSLVLSSGAISLQVNPGASLSSATGLVLTSGVLQKLASSVQSLALSSYSTINLYGAGTIGNATGTPVIQSLTLQGAGILGFDNGGGSVTINAQNVTLANPNNESLPGTVPGSSGAGGLVINANTITLGSNSLAVDGFSSVQLNANNGIAVSGTGALNAQGSLGLGTSEITGATGSNYTFNAQGGSLTLTKPTSSGSVTVADGLGASITLEGTSVTVDSKVYAPSGTITALATNGDVEVGSDGDLDVSGEAITFGNAVGYTSGGLVTLTSNTGNVVIAATSTGSATVNVSAPSLAGNAGELAISAPMGTASIADGALNGAGGAGGSGGIFNATLGQAPTLSGLTTPLTDGGFQTMNFDVLTGSTVVDGQVGKALDSGDDTFNGITSFTLTTETGAITVDNTINASGPTGGTINLYSATGVTLTSSAVLSVTGKNLDDAGEGGTIDIETLGGNDSNGDIGAINIEQGAQIYLGIGAGGTTAAAGSLHLRAPLLTDTLGAGDSALLPVVTGTGGGDAAAGGIAIDQLPSSGIVGAGSVVVEGYRVYEPPNGSIDSIDSTTGPIAQDIAQFSSLTPTLATQLGVSGNSLYEIEPGIEIINPNMSVNDGDLTLGSPTTNTFWDLSNPAFRTSSGLPGILTLRAANNLIFYGSLTDGFAYDGNGADPNDPENVSTSPYTWDLLPVGSQSWSYRLVSGAQFTSGASPANFGEVQSQPATPTGSLTGGSVELGQTIPEGFNFKTKTASTAATYAQLIRTGTGSITIDAGGSVYLMNQMATIYTAGQLAPTIPGSQFSSPTGVSDSKYESKVYGTSILPAPQYTAQYTENGGNVTINAGQDIAHVTLSGGVYVPDTTWQFPTNWLYRRGATSSTDVFDKTKLGSGITASTTWWVDFSNFFEGIGALGGGNVSLDAGGDIINVDAVVPTNARMPYADASGQAIPDLASNLVQLGGGDLSVIAGGTIEGGTYYVEQGNALIEAGTIETTYDADPARVSAYDVSLGENTPLPLTLFVGSGTMTVEATGDITLGSTVNPFLLPQGIGNNFNNESIFSTYGSATTVNVSSLLGTITIQGSQSSTNPLPGSLYDAYLSNASPGGLSSNFTVEQSLSLTPWTLTLDPTEVGTNLIDNVRDYATFYELSPPIFNATAFSGNIQYKSDQLLSPSAAGTLKLLAAGSVDGAFDLTGVGNGITATIAVLNDDPSQIPSITNPFGLGLSTTDPTNNPSIGADLTLVSSELSETPSYEDLSLTQLQSLNTPGLLHDNTTTPPVQIDTINGDIGDLTLISPEVTEISSGLDIQDASFYIQNNNAEDVSVVSANRDITLYDPTSFGLGQLGADDSFFAAFGDIQVSGPGTLEVLAGRNLNLGEGQSPNGVNFPGTGLGITSIGNARDPYLPFGGAQIVAAAGLGDTSGLSTTKLADYQDFESDYLDYYNQAASAESVIYLPELGSLLGVSGATNQQIWDIYSNTQDNSLTQAEQTLQASLTTENRDALATSIFYNVLRDAGRDHNNPSSTGFGNYDQGYAAIKTLFPSSVGYNAALFPSNGGYSGNISLTSREFKTESGGDIDILLPGGELDVGLNNNGTQAVDQGILTVDGGNISIFANGNVNVGTSRIFTLHGGNIIIWSSYGNIDAGAASRTVQSAPPTRVEVDSQSADVQTDLAGLATGGGIGVLETVVGAPPGDVDLIAPVGTVDAGDAGIRASGNVNVAAAQVLNAGNIQAGGSKTGVSTTSTPNVAAAVAGSNAAGSTQNAATASANQQPTNASPGQDLPSIITVQVLGFGGDDDDSASTETPDDKKASGATYLAEHP
ncbi:MAG TPA: filamentous hemagglutinin family protein [Candidatus Methylacidiphilales bacterium]|nr:filamentous hemagglutinin family protein [Candidatus Methylacidiphilales bacterium]